MHLKKITDLQVALTLLQMHKNLLLATADPFDARIMIGNFFEIPYQAKISKECELRREGIISLRRAQRTQSFASELFVHFVTIAYAETCASLVERLFLIRDHKGIPCHKKMFHVKHLN